MKKSFLCVDDYGQGGVWYLVLADSAERIREKLPFLAVVETRPEWMDDEMYERMKAQRTIDLDNLSDERALDLPWRMRLARHRGESPPISNEEAARLINAELEKLRSRKG
jgi:hypothetical protein